MPGNALTNEFFLSTATVMIGAQDKLLDLNVDEHSLGLTKNFSMSGDPKIVELTQGIRNQRVATMVTDMGIKVSFEMYEYTAKNLAYAAFLDASGTNFDPMADGDLLSENSLAAATSVTVAADKSAVYTAGKWVYVQKAGDDYVHIAKVVSSTYSTDTEITLSKAVPWAGTAGVSKIGLLNKLDVGTDTAVQYFAMKVVGIVPNGNKPLVLLFPKVQVTKGLAISFATENYSNMPFEVTPYQPVPTDLGYSADFREQVHIFRQ
jgi:hypothetical protein